MNQLNVKIQKDTRKWIDLRKWQNPFAVTLTFKKSSLSNNGKFDTRIYLDEEKASENLRIFLHLLNRKSFGNLYSRVGKKVKVFPILEKSVTKHLHYHIAIDCPIHIKNEKFSKYIEECWDSTFWGNKQIDIQNSANNGWISYITKLSDKESIADSIDWNNVHL